MRQRWTSFSVSHRVSVRVESGNISKMMKRDLAEVFDVGQTWQQGW